MPALTDHEYSSRGPTALTSARNFISSPNWVTPAGPITAIVGHWANKTPASDKVSTKIEKSLKITTAEIYIRTRRRGKFLSGDRPPTGQNLERIDRGAPS
ncbi:MAG TPA: hypothetical protein VFZ23_15815 [Pyrinomonadaceae bacterium]